MGVSIGTMGCHFSKCFEEANLREWIGHTEGGTDKRLKSEFWKNSHLLF